MSASVELGVPASRPLSRASPGRAPACGARTRAGSACLGLAMASGRCRIHGGASTGPRTAAGLARMVAAKTTHGRFAMSGAPQRLAQRFVWTFMTRAGLTAEATMLQAYLPAGMAARLDSAPDELLPPKHPSQVAFEALARSPPGTCLSLGLGRRARVARARLGVGGGVDGAAVVLRGRAAERLATRAETAAQAPWRAAIVAARALKCAVQEARGQMGAVRNDPMGGMAVGAAGGQRRGVRNDPIGGMVVGAVEGQTRRVRNDPIGGMAVGAAGGQSRGVRNDPIGGMVVGAASGQRRRVRNDPIGGMAVGAWAPAAPLETRVGVLAERRAGESASWAPGSPGLRQSLAREVEKRRLRAEVGVPRNDPVGGNTQGAHASGTVRPARLHRRSSAFIGGENCLPSSRASMRALALGSTTMARTWEPGVAEVLAARFGPVGVAGRLGVAGAPPEIAAMPGGDGAQRPYTRAVGSIVAGGREPEGAASWR